MRLRTVSPLAVFAVVLLFAATPAFAANEIAYQCDTDVCLLDPANPGAVTNLTDNGSTSYDEKPIWSPDGKKVAFVSDFTKSGHGEKNVFVMEPGAAEQAVNLAIQITPYSSGAKAIDELAWSPDGSRIAYTRGNNAGDDSVWVVNADGTTTFPLEIGGSGAKRHPTWSPDSSKIAYAVVKNAPEQIYVAPSTGGIGPRSAERRRARTELVARRLEDRLRRVPLRRLRLRRPPRRRRRRQRHAADRPRRLYGVDVQRLVPRRGTDRLPRDRLRRKRRSTG